MRHICVEILYQYNRVRPTTLGCVLQYSRHAYNYSQYVPPQELSLPYIHIKHIFHYQIHISYPAYLQCRRGGKRIGLLLKPA